MEPVSGIVGGEHRRRRGGRAVFRASAARPAGAPPVTITLAT